MRAAAAAFGVSPATAHGWWHRWIDGGRLPQSLVDRSSRPSRSPRLVAAELAERICACRRETGWGPRLVAGATGFAHSTVWKVLWRAGISRRPSAIHQTMARECGYDLTYRSHRHRADALPLWLDHYNRHRPHGSIGNRSPISRVHNVPGQDS